MELWTANNVIYEWKRTLWISVSVRDIEGRRRLLVFRYCGQGKAIELLKSDKKEKTEVVEALTLYADELQFQGSQVY